ncbi:MAG: tripartite tricarboxylate transporter permease [Eubacteriales bacterium]|nr:tripartite tricarboxylate transporter permease [Clostridiales bacterium]MDY5836488.1 tripartite tricarboxylate transporter permease [Eubacteriales bacterium]
MDQIIGVLKWMIQPEFILFTFIGSLAGLFVGSIPGLSVTMATALLVSVTYSWQTSHALATIMGVYVVGVYSGALSAILINIPGAPSSVVTTLDGYPLAKKGESFRALKYATFYSFVGSLFGLLMLWIAAKPVTNLALKFTPMDYFLLALFGLATVGSLTTKSFSKGLISAVLGLILSMVGIDSVVGTPRLTFGMQELNSGISIVPALVGLFGFSEVLFVISNGAADGEVAKIVKSVVKTKELLKHFFASLYYCIIGTFVGALPGAGGPVAAFLAYSEARRINKNPSVPFGEGAVEGIVASESANNACIGGALIPMLTLAIPGDAVTAIILSVFYVHGLRPGPMFLMDSPDIFEIILAGGFLGCIFLLLLGTLVAPRVSKIISVPKNLLLPVVTVLCVIGAFAGNNRMFDVALMFIFGIIGYFMRRRGYAVAPMTLALVLGNMMDSNFRRAISLASSESNKIAALFGRPITLVLLLFTIVTLLMNIPAIKRILSKAKKENKA